MSAPFEILRKNAAAIRLAELGALLHNVGKLHPEFKRVMGPPKIYDEFNYRMIAGRAEAWGASGELGQSVLSLGFWKAAMGDDESIAKGVFEEEIKLPGGLAHSGPPIAVGDLVEFHDNFERPRGLLCFLMQLAHMNASGSNKRQLEQEREESDTGKAWPKKDKKLDLKGQGKVDRWRSATVFGFEAETPDTGLVVAAACMKLAHAAADAINYSDWRKAVDGIVQAMEPFLADSQRPINDTRVSDMAQLGAAFLKPAIAYCVLRGDACPDEAPLTMNWRLLRIAVNGPDFVNRAVRIPDLLARRQLLRKALDGIREKLEWEIPLGNEIYRDENGSVFIVPVLADDHKAALLAEIHKVWSASGISDESGFADFWSKPFALGKEGGYAFQLGELLERSAPPLRGSRSLLVQAWTGKAGREICTVCGLRPFGDSPKCRERKVCETCLGRRDKRSSEWLSGPESRTQTIWIDEAADRNGRIVLFCARLRIRSWLDDSGFIEQSFFLDRASSRHMAPSFARLRRVWTTATDFWDQTLAAAKKASGSQPGRLSVSGMFRPKNGRNIAVTHAYYLGRHDRRLSLICKEIGADGWCTFLLAENAERACHLFELKTEGGDPDRFLRALQGQFSGEWNLEEPTGYGSPNRDLGTLAPPGPGAALGTEIEDQTWSPIIEILRDPTMLMFLAPAASGMQTVEETLKLYEDQMDRVRDRLGLDVGLVYAPSDTPLPALVQAGRAMLERPHLRRAWDVRAASKDGERVTVEFEDGPVWGLTMDRWRGNIETDAKEWIAFDELAPGQRVKVCESTFDFEFLETGGRRFEVAYDPALAKRRSPEKAHRPWLLEQTADLKRCWDILQGGLAMAQIKSLDGILDAKAEAWRPDRVPASFVRAVLLDSNWAPGPPSADNLDFLVRAADSGLLHDAIELFLSVAKPASADAMAEPSEDAESALALP